MPGLKKISGKECAKILCNHFSFTFVRQTGSHAVLKKTVSGHTIGTVVPMHPELKLPTLKSILKLAQVDEHEFSNYQ